MVEYTPKPYRSNWHDAERRRQMWPDTKDPEAPDLPADESKTMPKPEARGRWDDLIEKHALRAGVDPMWMKRIMKIESGGNPYDTTGSYKGLFQLSDKEFKRHGGSGSIYDPEQNIMAAANKLAQDKLTFKAKYGRDATLTDTYMIHQQGEAGGPAHAANPEGIAWQNIRKYYSSDAMAKKAIWGNVPDNLKGQFGSVENVKSSDLISIYDSKLEGRGMVGAREWKGHMKAIKEGKELAEPETELQKRGITQGEPQEPKEEVPIYHDDTRVVHAGVDAPSISMGRAVVAPTLSRAGRVPQ